MQINLNRKKLDLPFDCMLSTHEHRQIACVKRIKRGQTSTLKRAGFSNFQPLSYCK